MSKPGISISLGKPKTSISLPKSQSSASNRKPTSNAFALPPAKRSRLANDSDDEEEAAPKHEEVTGFDVSTGGAIASKSVDEPIQRVIKNPGNGDWRTRGRGKNILPEEVKAQQAQETSQNGAAAERDEGHKMVGLQLAQQSTIDIPKAQDTTNVISEETPQKEATEDEAALDALLQDGNGERSTRRTIESKTSEQGPYNEADDYKTDLATRPESATLDEYAEMPVEEFGMALLRGMGTKRKANGEVIKLETTDKPKAKESRSGYLGIGAKGVPKEGDVEIGAWGKADMRKNKKGEGFYTPVLLKDKRTGEMITEEELESRKKAAKEPGREDDWRDRRDRNLKDKGNDGYKDRTNGFPQITAPKRERSRSRDSHRRQRSRSKDRDRKYHDRSRDDSSRSSKDSHRDRYRDKGDRRDRYRDDDRYDSSSSRKSRHESGDGYDDRDRRRHRDDHHQDKRRGDREKY